MAQQLTEHETYVQLLRALNRLKKKQLCCGPYWMTPEGREADWSWEADSPEVVACCLLAAARIHQSPTGCVSLKTGRLKWAKSSRARFHYEWKAEERAVRVNEDFRRNDNSEEAMKARWLHVTEWLKQRIEQAA